MKQEFKILALILAALLIGIIVLLFKSDYRFEDNLESNKNYYAGSELEPRHDSAQDNNESDDSQADIQRDIEF